jgi:cytochrome c oxidase subunit 2
MTRLTTYADSLLLGNVIPQGFWMPEGASTVAGEIDFIFNFINWVCAFFFFGIVIAMVYFIVKYRRRSHVANIDGPTHNMPLEIIWTVVPLALVGVIFYVGLTGYIHLREAPSDSYDVNVTGQKWSWTFNHPEYDVTEGAVLTVPVDTPVRLLMGSEDVLHAVFIPAFRVKQDVIPGRYTTLWFEAIKTGEYQIYCAEYCGMDHSKMLATCRVLPKEEFVPEMERLAREYEDMADEQLPAYALNKLYNRCKSCHSLDGSRGTGPSFKGLWDRVVSGEIDFTDSTSLSGYRGPGGEFAIPENYVRDSIVNPMHLIVETYASQMPTNFGKQLKPRQIDAIVGMLKNLDSLVDEQGEPLPQEPASSDEEGSE